jgi:hypothetical protein
MNIASYNYSDESGRPVHPSALVRWMAQFISFIFHPLLITAYGVAFLIYVHPAAFAGVDVHTRNLRMLSIVLYTVLFPVFTLFLAWRLKLVQGITLQSRQDRLVGFIVTMFFYFWISYVFRNLSDIPPVAEHFVLGSFLALCGGWMCTIFYKVSLHALCMGGLLGFFLQFGAHDPFVSGLYLTVVILIIGFVCSARLLLGAHTNFEMTSGFMIGLLAQILAWYF